MCPDARSCWAVRRADDSQISGCSSGCLLFTVHCALGDPHVTLGRCCPLCRGLFWGDFGGQTSETRWQRPCVYHCALKWFRGVFHWLPAPQMHTLCVMLCRYEQHRGVVWDVLGACGTLSTRGSACRGGKGAHCQWVSFLRGGGGSTCRGALVPRRRRLSQDKERPRVLPLCDAFTGAYEGVSGYLCPSLHHPPSSVPERNGTLMVEHPAEWKAVHCGG